MFGFYNIAYLCPVNSCKRFHFFFVDAASIFFSIAIIRIKIKFLLSIRLSIIQRIILIDLTLLLNVVILQIRLIYLHKAILLGVSHKLNHQNVVMQQLMLRKEIISNRSWVLISFLSFNLLVLGQFRTSFFTFANICVKRFKQTFLKHIASDLRLLFISNFFHFWRI